MQIAKLPKNTDNEEKTSNHTEIQMIPRKDINSFTPKDVIPITPIDKGNYVEIPTSLNVKDKNVISCLCISDTHGQHRGIEETFDELPKADILIHSGDFTKIGHWGDIKDYDKWISEQLKKNKYKHCILIGGNHDITLHSEYYTKTGYNRFHAGNPHKENMLKYAEKCSKRAVKNSIYLRDSMIELYGIKFYGSPWVPYFNNWAFMLKRGEQLKNVWKHIPKDTDVLITHGPSLYHGDLCANIEETLKSNCVGDIELLRRIKEVKPKYHVFGHNHEGYGVTKHEGLDTVFINASTLDRDYKVANKPVMIYIEGKSNECYDKNATK